MAENKIKGEGFAKEGFAKEGFAKENYAKPQAENAKRPDTKAFACEPCEHEHEGAGDRCSGL